MAAVEKNTGGRGSAEARHLVAGPRRERADRCPTRGAAAETTGQSDFLPDEDVHAIGSLLDDFDRDVWHVFGVPVDAINLAGASNAVVDAARTGRKLRFVTPNVNMLCMARTCDAARADILNNELSLADGAPLVALARLLGAPIRERVAGSDLFAALRRRAAPRGRKLKVFFFGGRDGAAAAAHAALNADGAGGFESVGWFNPGFGDVEAMSGEAVLREIDAAGPDFVVVALGARKGNAWIGRNGRRLAAPVVSHLGAVLDFAAGSVTRAPRLVAGLGLEWAWRVFQEPSLWRRYWSDGLTLLRILAMNAAPLALNPPRATGVAPAATLDGAGATLVVRVAGDHFSTNLKAARSAFRRAAGAGRDVTLDLSDVGAFDAAFLGQALMLEKALASQGLSLGILGVSARVRRRLAWHGASFAEAAATARTAPADVAEVRRTA